MAPKNINQKTVHMQSLSDSQPSDKDFFFHFTVPKTHVIWKFNTFSASQLNHCHRHSLVAQMKEANCVSTDAATLFLVIATCMSAHLPAHCLVLEVGFVGLQWLRIKALACIAATSNQEKSRHQVLSCSMNAVGQFNTVMVGAPAVAPGSLEETSAGPPSQKGVPTKLQSFKGVSTLVEIICGAGQGKKIEGPMKVLQVFIQPDATPV